MVDALRVAIDFAVGGAAAAEALNACLSMVDRAIEAISVDNWAAAQAIVGVGGRRDDGMGWDGVNREIHRIEVVSNTLTLDWHLPSSAYQCRMESQPTGLGGGHLWTAHWPQHWLLAQRVPHPGVKATFRWQREQRA